MRRLLLVLLIFGLGCTPELNNNPVVGDDDDATGDDDDATGDDDDDATGDDDDDGTLGCDDAGAEWIEMSSSVGPDFVGSWYQGELSVAGSTITVIDAAGVEVTFTASVGDLLGELGGPGRVFWFTGGMTAWGTDNLLAIESWRDGLLRLAIGNIATPPPELQDDWGFSVTPDLDGCGEVIRDECGDSLPLPVTVTMPGDDGQVVEALVLPGEEVYAGETTGFQHQGGRVRLDVICPDTPTFEVSWLYAQLIQDVVIGAQ